MFLERTPEGMVAVYHRESGERFVRWPVDARGMVGSGEYATIPPTDQPTTADAPVIEVDPPVAIAGGGALSPTGAPLVVATKESATLDTTASSARSAKGGKK